MQYIGRFAPSPTGPLHFGSLISAVASYCDAKANQGKWLVRMEDSDKPREIAGAADDILRCLEAFGFAWDGEVLYQSQRDDVYTAAFNQLKSQHMIYACTCTRKEIADSSITQGIDGAIYPKTCYQYIANKSTRDFNASASLMDTTSWRINVDSAGEIEYLDAVQGKITQNLARDVGDFILKRKDGLFAYQLAVVVDDAAQGVTDVVRGADLLDSTPRQIYLQQLLGLATPHYAHLPVAVNANQEKLSKQTHAKPLQLQNTPALLYQALCFLGQQPPGDLQHCNTHTQLLWAVKHWQLKAIPIRQTCPII